MGWRNDGVQQHVRWSLEGNPSGICHYGERWRDRYAMWTRTKAVRKVLRGQPVADWTVLDVGAGDGQWSEWILRTYDPRALVPIDLAEFGYPLIVMDVEDMAFFRSGAFDLALVVTVLPHVERQGLALDELCRVADRVLFVDMLKDPTPRWARGLPHRHVYPLSALDQWMKARGYRRTATAGCGHLDGLLFTRTRWMPKRLAYALTRTVDTIARTPRRSNYAAAMYTRR